MLFHLSIWDRAFGWWCGDTPVWWEFEERSKYLVPPRIQGGSPQHVVSRAIGCLGWDPGVFERARKVRSQGSSQWYAHENASLWRKTLSLMFYQNGNMLISLCQYLKVNEQRSWMKLNSVPLLLRTILCYPTTPKRNQSINLILKSFYTWNFLWHQNDPTANTAIGTTSRYPWPFAIRGGSNRSSPKSFNAMIKSTWARE